MLVFGLFLAAIASWVSVRRIRSRLEDLSHTIEDQQAAIEGLITQVAQLRRQTREPVPPSPVVTQTPPPVPVPRPATAPPAMPPPVPTVPTVVPPPPAAAPLPTTPAVVPPPTAAPRENPWPDLPPKRPPLVPPPAPAAPSSAPVTPPVAPPAPRENPWPELTASSKATTASAPAARSALPPPIPPRRPPPVTTPPPPEAFDLESLIGVKLFSAIAGIALVVAAIFFLRYSVEHGWLQPPIRVAIGILVAVTLLVLCEIKAARQYPATANALDAAAIAILFSTFFAAHALWNLIPSLVTFVLLGVVTALAVLLSLRRESLFIAVLGLLGGFATPALLSTGENQPIPLFAYLMLLNIGLAWVAYRQTWPLLTALTLILTTIYQWGWVFKFLDASSLTLGMSVFVMFPLVALVGLVLAKRRVPEGSAAGADKAFEYTALVAAALPLFFAVYLSTVPAYGNRPWLLFGFVLLLDAGLFAVAVGRGQSLLHAAGAMATLVVMACWLAFSYAPGAASPALVFCAVFVVFFLVAPLIAVRLGHPLEETGADVAAPLLLFVPTVLARTEPAFSAPFPLFATLLALVLLIAWRAIAGRRGALYYFAAFFAIATQAAWSSAHLSLELLRTAVAIYAVFGITATAVPLVARRVGRPLEPKGGSGFVLIASLVLLLFLSFGPIAPAALWALALLLAIINAGLFIESGSGGLPLVSVAGSFVSWLVLASWWLPSVAMRGCASSGFQTAARRVEQTTRGADSISGSSVICSWCLSPSTPNGPCRRGRYSERSGC